MAHNARIRPALTWTIGSAVTSAELEALDQAQFEAINGDDGGTWAPATPLTIGGAGMDLTGPVAISGALEITGTTLIEDDVTVTGAAVILESVSSLTLDASTLDLTNVSTANVGSGCEVNILSGANLNVKNGGDIEVESGGDINVQSGGEIAVASGGAINLASGGVIQAASGSSVTVASGGTLTSAGTTVISGATTISGATAQTGTLTKSGTGGRTVYRINSLASNASHAVDVDFDTYYYTQSTAVSRTLTASVTTAPVPVAGERIKLHIYNTAAANSVTVADEGLGPLFAVTNTGVRAELEFDGTSWRVIGFARDPALGGTVTWTGNP